ncbi:hypothetical protein GF322_04980 [Candidatus Dependentiae bacterium]|nr:hypothetical protein [Candidatus Dependentiae bacterium]
MKISNFFYSLLLFFISFSELIFAKTKISSDSAYKTIQISNLSQNGINSTFAAKFALFIAILLFATILTGKILKLLLKLPTVAGQIIGGILLGPSLINLKNIKFFSNPLKFIDSSKHLIYQITSSDLFFFFVLLISSAITVSYLLWLAGHETDVADMAKVGVESTFAGILGAIVPIITIGATAFFTFGNDYSFATSIGLGVVFSATSVSIPIAMLISQNKMNLRSSKATMGAAIVDDILAIIIFSMFIVTLQSGLLGKFHCLQELEHCSSISNSLLYMLFSFIIMFFFGRYFIKIIPKWLKRFKLSHIIPAFAALMMLSYFSLAELFGGLAGITGAYFAGFFHRMGDPRHKAVRAISPFVNSILLPIFLGSVGMQVDISILKLNDWIITIILLIVAILSKLIGCHITTFLSNFFIQEKNKKWSFLESYLFGSSMVARGEVGLVIATILNGTHLMTPNQYVICVAVIVLTTIASPIMLSIGFTELDKKKQPIDSEKEFSVKIGPFNYLSSRHLFDVITSILEKEEKVTPIIELSEGKKIFTVEGKNLKIMLIPDIGIVFKGDEIKIHDILDHVKSVLIGDIEAIPEV